MKRDTALWLALGGAVAFYIYTNQSQLATVASNAGDAIMSDLVGWKNVNQGPNWVPYLNSVEAQLGLPADLLARVAYQESSFRQGVIDGTTPSPAGALGMMQMMPAYFTSVRVPVPFTATDTQNQIVQAGQQLLSLFNEFADWQLALAAYNAGAGNVQKYAGIPPFPETQNYVSAITADVPAIAPV